MNIVELGPAAQRLAELVARAKDDQLGKPTPCPAYLLGDLIGFPRLLEANGAVAARRPSAGTRAGTRCA